MDSCGLPIAVVPDAGGDKDDDDDDAAAAADDDAAAEDANADAGRCGRPPTRAPACICICPSCW